MTMLTENEVLDLVLSSIKTGLDEHKEHIVFQQLRVAPESLIVHFAAFEIHREFEKRWPGQFHVLHAMSLFLRVTFGASSSLRISDSMFGAHD